MNTATITALEAHTRIQEAANAPALEIRDGSRMEVGDIAHQGDVYLLRLKSRPKGATKKVISRQLAPGTSQGSRHCISDGPMLFKDDSNTDPLIGPVIVADKEFTLTHPEHAHHRLPPGIYQVGYQLDVAEQERRAVRD